MIPEWSEKSFLYMASSQFLSKQLKKFFVRAPSSISQCGGKTNRILFQRVFLAMGNVALEQYKGEHLLTLSSLSPHVEHHPPPL